MILLKWTLIIDWLRFDIVFPKYLNSILLLLYANKKNDWNILIYYKWALLLSDIRYSFKKTDIFLLLTLVYNKNIISKSINIISRLGDQLELMDNMIRNKIILIKRDLMIIQNYYYTVYWQQNELLLFNRFH